ncbi:hypothetical protein EGW08_016105, partial [Elysia chlorotica]
YCYVVPDSGGWVVIQRRVTGSVSFNRTWTEYKHGFGSFDGDFWLGNEKIHEIASSGWYEMRVEMTFDGIGFYAYFKRFIMMDESMSFKLIVGKYSGTAGNSLKLQSRQSFSTPDKDNDKNYFQNCAKENTGGWWFASCLGTNLNGQWGVTDGTAMKITKELEETFVQLRTMVLFALKESMFPQRCANDMTTLDSLFFPSSYATVYPNGLLPITFPHYCHALHDSGGWVVIQRRVTGSVSFNRTWTEYKHGFGSFDSDFWLGNEKIHEIASSGWYEMRVEMTFDGIGFYAYYKRFIMMDESMSFKMIVGKYRGTAGNSLRLQRRQAFSTPDKDNDKNYFQNCAQENTDFWSESVESLNRLDPSILEPKVCKRGMATHRVLPYQSNVHAPYVLIQTAPQFDVPFPMVCEFITDGGGWIVIHRRTIGKLDFNREWQQYKEGFGELDGDFWLGLEKIHKLTSRWTHELRVELGYQGAVYYANYDSFYVEGEYFSYSLNIGTYSGTAGDSLRYHDHMGFSTTDQDNDDWPRGSCANQNGGGWWFANCDTSNLNGNWAQS